MSAGLTEIKDLIRREISDLKNEQLKDLKTSLDRVERDLKSEHTRVEGEFRASHTRLADDQRRLWEAVRTLELSDRQRSGSTSVMQHVIRYWVAPVIAAITSAVGTIFITRGH